MGRFSEDRVVDLEDAAEAERDTVGTVVAVVVVASGTAGLLLSWLIGTSGGVPMKLVG